MIECSERIEAFAVPGLPIVDRGADVPALIGAALEAARVRLEASDVLVVTSKLLSRAEGRFVSLSSVAPSAEAIELANRVGKDPRVVELILRESTAISRQAPGVLVVRHRLGFVVANAGIDASNAEPASVEPGSGPWVLLLPEAPDASALAIRARLEAAHRVPIGVVVTDSFGRPFRLGTVGMAVGVSGLPALWDRRGERDLFGRALEHTVTALADQVAAVADLVAGQAAERRPVVVVRGLRFAPSESGAVALQRSPGEDLYA
jgi:coenzyme F420-0:L-glutamate ligase/coenzyme F420-1:gamma-L-glutamate ligase